jgi:hypothetical protein
MKNYLHSALQAAPAFAVCLVLRGLGIKSSGRGLTASPWGLMSRGDSPSSEWVVFSHNAYFEFLMLLEKDLSLILNATGLILGISDSLRRQSDSTHDICFCWLPDSKVFFEMRQSLMNFFPLGWRLHIPNEVNNENSCKGNKSTPNNTRRECRHFCFLSLQPFLYAYDGSSNWWYAIIMRNQFANHIPNRS